MAKGKSLQHLQLTLLALLAFTKYISCAAQDLDAKAAELKEAINADYKPSLTNWDQAVLNDTLSNLKLELILWSHKARRFEFTVFTQLTVDRLKTLRSLCVSYTGPLSAAVYVALVQPSLVVRPSRSKQGAGAAEAGTGAASSSQPVTMTAASYVELQEAVKQVEALHKEIESDSESCQLDVMLFYELFDSEQSKLLYPVNYLRNYARMQVRTRLLAMIDVDMFPSRTFSAQFQEPESVKRYEAFCDERRATVLPAFEPTRPGVVGQEMAAKLITVSKEELATIHGRNKQAMQFKLRVFPRGHTPTDYQRWFTTSQPYQVSYKRFYEPWFITCDEIMPWYDVDFRGYGMNKIVLVAALNYYNYTFWIHPSAWLVHNPHGDTEVRKLVAREASDVNKHNMKLPENALYRKLTLLFGNAKRGMMRGTYTPRTDPRAMAVYERVKWLRPPPQLVGTPVPEEVFI